MFDKPFTTTTKQGVGTSPVPEEGGTHSYHEWEHSRAQALNLTGLCLIKTSDIFTHGDGTGALFVVRGGKKALAKSGILDGDLLQKRWGHTRPRTHGSPWSENGVVRSRSQTGRAHRPAVTHTDTLIRGGARGEGWVVAKGGDQGKDKIQLFRWPDFYVPFTVSRERLTLTPTSPNPLLPVTLIPAKGYTHTR